MAEAVASIPYITGTEDRARSISLRLDPDLNDGLTSFLYADRPAICEVITYPDGLVFETKLSDGQWQYYGTGAATFTEYIEFNDTDRGFTTYPIASDGLEEMEWIGPGLGGVQWLGANEIKSERSGVAVLKTTYKANCRKYSLQLGQRDEAEWPVLVRLKAGTSGEADRPTASLTVDFYGQDEGAADYILTVVDYCTEEPVYGAAVILDGTALAETTDSNGEIDLGLLKVGSTHGISIQKTGYDPFTDVKFTVPEPEEEDGCDG